MIIIYNCYGGSHSSVASASIHAGLIKDNKVPTAKELMNLPFYDRQVAKDHGHIRFIGEDEKGNKIYVTSKHNMGYEYEKTLRSIASILDFPNEKITYIDTMPYVNWLMMLGGFLSRRLGWIKIGRPIVIKGTQLSFFKFGHLVNVVKYKYGR